MQSRLLFISMALALGAILPIQAAINARLAKTADNNPVMAAFVSFAVGTIALMIYLVIAGQFNFRYVSGNSRWWIWTGGLLGTFFVAGIVILLPKLGVTLAFSLVIAGQMLAAIVFDQFGWMGLAVKEISAGKITGAILLIMGVFLIRKY
ncbi:MAG: DMT family transporter [Bacteroidota bacterium]|nr:DMT family transporter [Bacteroidota bacterium]MDP4211576.1 DMT family transporter [Bacteroidota bacterium]MDP4249117.1 DMT family transporter [Bacteroidota bacterium]